MARFLQWAMPGIVFSVAFAFSACGDAVVNGADPGDCIPGAGGGGPGGTGGAGGSDTTSSTGTSMSDGGPVSEAPPGGQSTNGSQSFDHANDPGESGQKDPFEILKERAEEGPPQIRTRLHSCGKIPYTSLGEFLSSRGVNTKSIQPKSAGLLYQSGGDALGAAKFDAREGERLFNTTAGATKLFDIFVQAAPEIIANITDPTKAPACVLNGVSNPMFDPTDGSCVRESLSCIMGRPVREEDLILCDLMVAQAKPNDMADVARKRVLAVAAFLSAAHTCE
jgi:hypothetical protein